MSKKATDLKAKDLKAKDLKAKDLAAARGALRDLMTALDAYEAKGSANAFRAVRAAANVMVRLMKP